MWGTKRPLGGRILLHSARHRRRERVQPVTTLAEFLGRESAAGAAPTGMPEAGPSRTRWRRSARLPLRGAVLPLGFAVLVVTTTYLSLHTGAIVGLTQPPIVVSSPSASTGTPPAIAGTDDAPNHGSGLAAGPSRVAIAKVGVFDPTGDPDNAGQVAQVIASNPTSGWSTYTYRRPFPAIKSGVGIMVSLAAPERLSSMTITSPSTGSHLEIRSAPAPDSAFDQTTPIAATSLSASGTTVSLTATQPVRYILIWITTLGGSAEHNVTTIEHLKFERATG
jgi:hypothetical protein